MTAQIPPKLPSPERALPVYLQAVATILPACFIWFFANIFLVPKLQYIWKIVGLTQSTAQWMMDSSYFFAQHMQYLFGAVFAVFLVLESRYPAWPRYRRTAVATVTVLFHTTVLIGVTAIATAVLLAAPLLTKKASSTPAPHADSAKVGVE